MGTPKATELLSVLIDVTTGNNRAVIEEHPPLAWMLPHLDASIVTLRRLVGYVAPEDNTREPRDALALADERHDDGHRFIFNVLIAFESRGSAEERAAVARARRDLYPKGLAGTQFSYDREVEWAQWFKNRLQEPSVRAGLEIVERHVPEVVAAQRDVLEALDSMRGSLTELDGLAAKAKAYPPRRELFAARRDAQSLLSNFFGNVELVFRGDEPTKVERRVRLLAFWRHALADAAERVAEERPTVDALDTPET